MRTTLQIDDDVYLAAKTFAESTGTSIGKVISEVFRRGLASRREQQLESVGIGGFPVFRTRSDGIVTSDMVAAALDEP